MQALADLSDDFEYAIGWDGQSNAVPQGTLSEAFAAAPELDLDDVGIPLAGIVIVTGTGTETLVVATASTTGEWNGAKLRLGTNSVPLAGYATIIKNTSTGPSTSTFTVQWTVAAAAGTVSGYTYHPDKRWAYYPSVRVLVPYQPLTDVATETNVPYPSTTAKALRLPGGTVPSAITSFADLAAFAELTFLEGIDSFGISNVAHTAGTVATTTFAFTGAAPPTDFFVDGYLRVEWTLAGVPKLSWSRIGANSGVGFSGLSWLGDGTPDTAGGAVIGRWTAWVDHYNNHPNAYLPGEGFTYPNNDMQPYSRSAIGAMVHNVPRGITGFAYGVRFGAAVALAYRLSAALGKRINLVHLGAIATSLAPASVTTAGFQGTVGWWNHQTCTDWAPSRTDSLFARYVRMLTVMAPNALTAEGNTKPLRFLGLFRAQGETDTARASSREHYGDVLQVFFESLRTAIETAGLSPYTNGSRIPIVQLKVTTSPWSLSGTFTIGALTLALDGDTEQLVNNAIVETTVADGFGGFVETDDATKGSDPAHFNGAGEVQNGKRLALTGLPLIDLALSYGSTAWRHSQATELAICNSALALIGDTGNLTSFNDQTAQAVQCKLLFPQVRDTLLQLRRWSFALDRVALTTIRGVPSSWSFAYVVPGYVLDVVAVLPPNAGDDEVLGTLDILDPRSTISRTYMPVRHVVERTARGNRVIYTNIEDAQLRYQPKVVDARRYPALFRSAVESFLASQLASTFLKNEDLARRMLQRASAFLHQAATVDGSQRYSPPEHIPSHLANR